MTTDMADRCRQCVFYQKDTVNDNCTVCAELSFRESILCELNNQGQEGDEKFVCRRFRPDLKIVGAETGLSQYILPVARDKKDYFKDVLSLINGLGRCGNGKCSCRAADSRDEMSVRQCYHVVWSTVGRRKIFTRPELYVPFFHDAFLTCGALINGKACLVWLAADHLHFYLEPGVDEQVMDVAEDIQLLTQDALLEEFKELNDQVPGIVWNRKFFIENIE